MSRLLVLGATGATGQHLVAQALAAGHRVTAVSRHPEALAQRHDRLRRGPAEPLGAVSIPRADVASAILACLADPATIRRRLVVAP